MEEILQEIVESNASEVNYFAFGSNLYSKTFKKRRKINPISEQVTSISGYNLCFDLPGLPYFEPSFANLIPSEKGQTVGVRYAVTPKDLSRIFASEGGGSGYKLIEVICDDGIPAYTLMFSEGRRICDPSKRYMNLIISGAIEHELPKSYVEHLKSITTFKLKSLKQKIGAVLFASCWLPLVVGIFSLTEIINSRSGRVPKWLVRTSQLTFKSIWWMHDSIFSNIFGRGDIS